MVDQLTCSVEICNDNGMTTSDITSMPHLGSNFEAAEHKSNPIDGSSSNAASNSSNGWSGVELDMGYGHSWWEWPHGGHRKTRALLRLVI